MKKGQLAVETLLIYGVAILIVMLAIGALIGFGVLDMSSMFPEKCDISGIKLICKDWLVAKEGNVVKLQLDNAVGNNIAIKGITIVGEGDNTGLWSNSGSCNYNITGDPSAGDTNADSAKDTYIFVNGDTHEFVFNDTGCAIGVPTGKRIKGKITVEYSNVGVSFEKKAFGTIDVKVS